jgi:hypothetical protein
MKIMKKKKMLRIENIRTSILGGEIWNPQVQQEIEFKRAKLC